MAKKKTKKPNISSAALERARRELHGGSAPVAKTVDTSRQDAKPKAKPLADSYVVTSKKHGMSKEELAEEYEYVIADLRSMGTLAGVLFIAMVVVSLLIEQLV